MAKRNIWLILTALAAVAGCAEQGEPVDLKLNFEKGQTFEVVLTRSTT